MSAACQEVTLDHAMTFSHHSSSFKEFQSWRRCGTASQISAGAGMAEAELGQ